MYDNPQYSQPNPETYRRNFGLDLWKAGYSEAMDYACQHEQPNIHLWNDMATGILDRMTYPTSSGVVGTMAWEEFREGIDDVRYLTLLENLLNETAEANSSANEIRSWLNELDVQGDLDEVRREITERILTLRGQIAATLHDR